MKIELNDLNTTALQDLLENETKKFLLELERRPPDSLRLEKIRQNIRAIAELIDMRKSGTSHAINRR